ncbi:glycosyltransferase family 2 protein [Photobacterium aphoticum]|nr:glycosyltransferase family 2 protein [Photobacterium aphoticum]
MKKVAALTVVKDESPYILDWINHYLYFGFHEIYVAINRTSDSTSIILNRFAENDHRIKIFHTDWLDMFPNKDGINPQIQIYSFCFLLEQARLNGVADHVLTVDADEFWFPENFKENISEYLSGFGHFDVLSIPWACQSGDDKPYMLPFENKNITVFQDSNVKSVINLSSLDKMSKFLLHIPDFEPGFVHLNANGNSAFRVDDKSQRIKTNVDGSNKSMILHRMLRSEQEYLSILLRQRPGSTFPLKDNRNGFNKNYKSTIAVNSDALSDYHDFLINGISECSTLIENSKREQIARNCRYEELKVDLIEENFDKFIKVLRGTSMLNKIVQKLVSSSSNVDVLRDAAIKLESIDLELSFKLMSKAKELRPKGPVISRKLTEYTEKLG